MNDVGLRVSTVIFNLSLHHSNLRNEIHAITVGNEIYPLISGDTVVIERISTVGNSSVNVLAIDTEIDTPSSRLRTYDRP